MTQEQALDAVEKAIEYAYNKGLESNARADAKNNEMIIQIPFHYTEAKITNTNWFIAKSMFDTIRIKLPEPQINWWISSYFTNDDFIEIMLVDSSRKRGLKLRTQLP